MKQKHVWIWMVLGFVSSPAALSQSDINLVTHWNNRANYNPAFIARTDYLYLFANARHQWFGVEGYPKVYNVQASEYFHGLRSAFGLSFVTDKIGLTQAFNPMLNYAFRIAKENNWSLAMGLSAGTFVRTVDGSLFEAETISDPSLLYTKYKIIKPDANAGIEFQNAHFIFGLSSTHLLSVGSKDSVFLNANHRYGYAIYKNNNLDLLFYKVGLLVVNRNNLTVVEGNIFVRLKYPTGLMKGPREVFDLGFTYRSSGQIVVLFGVMLSPDLRIGYAYDQSLIPGYNRNGTHEIMLEYRIFCKAASTKVRCGNDLFWYH
jgi:type IX secretion system PorP/SprF family membrane protein